MEVGSKLYLDPERRPSCSPYPKPLCHCCARSPGLACCRRPRLAHSDVRGHSRHRTPYDLQPAPRHPGLAPGHPSSYHRVFSRRRWSLWPLAHGLVDLILRHWVPAGSVALAGDDTVDEHRGAHVYGKGRHRDPVRSTHSYTAYRWGHKWVVLAILVRFPFANRPWALPVLVALYRSREWNQQHRRRHRTPAQLLRRLVAVLLHWFPHRHFTLTGDGGYGSHEMARFAHRHRRRLTLVSRFVPDAQLYTPPPVIAGKRPAHRPRTKGRSCPPRRPPWRRPDRRTGRPAMSPGTAAAGATSRW